jgi:putative flippase GtrA
MTNKQTTTESRFSLGKFRELIVFGLVGVSNTLIDIGVTTILSWLLSATSGFLLGAVNVVGFSAAVVNSYILNKRWTFKHETKTTRGEFTKFFLISLGGLVINTTVVVYGERLLLELLEIPVLRVLISKVLATIFTLGWNYVGYKLFVFK